MAFLLIYIIRPHILIIMSPAIAVVSLYLVFSLKNSVLIKALSTIVFMITCLMIMQYTFSNYLRTDDISFESIIAYGNSSHRWYANAHSTVDISEYNIFMKIFTFLYRPFFESFNIKYLLSSFDNLIYLLLTVYLFLNIKYMKLNYMTVFNVVFLIVSIMIFSITIANNLGVSIRYKMMVLPMFFYLVVHIYKRKEFLKK
ncbi:hypothetical protein JHD50_12580 [Sulfurimonas sp. MAG313]|nr:hypothetical protein [Sulfurimonas sp. MAG313]MDF1882123.1 hypothetical protein [Sulfurimonas sp. MAG313]